MKLAVAVCIIALCVALVMASPPKQVHLAFGADPTTQIVVHWSTASMDSAETAPFVTFGTSPNGTVTAKGTWWKFTNGNPKGLQYQCRVYLNQLKPNTTYYYKANNGQEASEQFFFRTMPVGSNWEPHLLVYGDMGKDGGAPTLPLLKADVQTGKYIGIVHVGDFAYDLDDEGGVRGDEFMERIEEIAAFVPYMTAVGNHEIAHNFSHYRNRFSMPGNSDNMWYSWNCGPIHFVAYSTEVYSTNGPIAEQIAWLTQDLKKANLPENRKAQPWIITYGHRPMYCSNLDGDDCTTPKSKIRAAFEKLFFDYGVDVIIEAHEHSYERLWPVYNETVTQHDYVNPKAPVHIISGMAGCNEDNGVCVNPMQGPKGPWSAFRSWFPGLYGYGRLKVHNSTNLEWEQMLDVTGTAEDVLHVIQKSHGPFAPIKIAQAAVNE